MNASPIPAIRELPERVQTDLVQALRAGRLTEAATAFMVRYAMPAVSEAAAAELSSLLASRLYATGCSIADRRCRGGAEAAP